MIAAAHEGLVWTIAIAVIVVFVVAWILRRL